MATENALVVKYHVINHHHISARSPCRPIMNCFHNLSFVSFRWWMFTYFGYVRENNKQGKNNCIIQHEYFIITQHEYFIIKPCQQRSLSILLLGVVRYKYCILVQCQEQCWLFDVTEVKKIKASTYLCIVYENTLLKYESQHCSCDYT